MPPCWESKSDWEIFKLIAAKVSELAAVHLPDPRQGPGRHPAAARHPDELAQPRILDWAKGECEPIPGKTMPQMAVVERDYVNLYNRFISLGPTCRATGLGAHGINMARERPVRRDAGDPAHRGVGRSKRTPRFRGGGRRQRHPLPRPRDQRRGLLPRLPGRGGEDRAATDGPGGAVQGGQLPLRRPGPAAPADPHQPLLVAAS